MIQSLATAIEKDPFKMVDGAHYLRTWVAESMSLAPALDVSIIDSAAVRGSLARSQSANPQAAVALEPAVGQVRVEAGRFATNGALQANPKMEVVGGIAESFKNEGFSWEESFDKAFQLWGKLNLSLQSALPLPPLAADAPPVDECLDQPIEDDSAVVLQEEADF